MAEKEIYNEVNIEQCIECKFWDECVDKDYYRKQTPIISIISLFSLILLSIILYLLL